MASDVVTPSRSQLIDAGLSELPVEWGVAVMGSLLAEDRGISVGVMYPGDHDPDGVPLIKAGDLTGNTINPSPDFRISHATHAEYRRTEFQGGEILMTLVGDVGSCAIVPEWMAGWNAARAVAVMRLREPSDAHFVTWCLRSPPLRHTMDVWCNTTVQATLNLKEIKQLALPWPAKKERQAIACILGSLDDKIELNRRMNRTLEGMARAIFKSWFVDFDPVRAKAAGKPPPGLKPALANLFPDRFEDSELGEIPKGWKVGTVGKLCEFAYGKALKAEDRVPGLFPVMGSNGQVGTHNESLVKGPGVVVGRKGNPGIVTWVNADFFPIDTTFYVVPLDKECPLSYLAAGLERLDLAHLGADSAVPGLNRNIAYGSKIVRPDTAALTRFDEFMLTVRRRQDAAERQSCTLAALRDTLLPKLISGELRVPDAERIAARAV